MGPQTEFLETIITCKGNYYSPDFVSQFNSFKFRLQKLVVPDNDKDLHVEKIEPWNSIRVTLKLPIEAANKLKQLAEQQNYLLRDMGVLAVQINKQQISLSLDRLQSRPRVPFNASMSMLPNVPASSLFSLSSSSLALSLPSISASTMSSIPSSSLSVPPILNTSSKSLSILTSSIPITSSLQTSSIFVALPTSNNSISSLPILTSFSSLSSTASPSTSFAFHQCTTTGYSSPQTTHSFMNSNILKHTYQPIKDSFINLNTPLKSSISTTQFQNTSLNHLSSKVTFSSNTNISLTTVDNSSIYPNQNFASSSPLLVNLLRSPGSRNNNPQLQVLDLPDSTNDFSLHLKRKRNQPKKSKRLKGTFDVAGALNHNLYLPNKSSPALFSTLNSERIGSFKNEQKEFQEVFNDHQDFERNNNATSPFSTNLPKLTHTLSNIHTTIPLLNHSTSHLSLSNNKLHRNYPSNLHLSSSPPSIVSKHDLMQKINHNSIYQFTPQPNISPVETFNPSSLSNLVSNLHHQSSKHNFSNSTNLINRTYSSLPSDHSSKPYNSNATNNISNYEQHHYLQSNLKTLNDNTLNSNNNNISNKDIFSKHHSFNNMAFEMSGFLGPNGQINVSGGGTSQKNAFIKSIHEAVEVSVDITKKSAHSQNASPSEWNSTSKTSTESLQSSITNNLSSSSLDTMHNQVPNRKSISKAGFNNNVLQKDGFYKNSTNKNEIHEDINKNISINADVDLKDSLSKDIIRDKVSNDTIKREKCQQFLAYSNKQSDSGSSTPISNLKASSHSYPTHNSTLDDYISNNSSDNSNKDKINNNNDINSKIENKSNPSSEENKSINLNLADMNLQFDLSDPFSNSLKLPKRALKNIEESHLPFKSKTNLTVAQLLEQVEIAKNSIPSKNFPSITLQSTEECGLTKCFSASSPSPNNYSRLVSSGPQVKTSSRQEGKLEPLPMPITSPGYPHNLTESVQKAMAVVDFHNSPPSSPHSQSNNKMSSPFKNNVWPLNQTQKSDNHRPMSCNDLKSVTAQDGDKYEGMKMYSEGELHEIMKRGSDHNTTASTNSNNSTLSAVEPDMNFCLNAEDENHLDSLISLRDYDDIEKLAEALASNINDGNLDDVMLMNEDFFNDEQLHQAGLKTNVKIASKPSHKLHNSLIQKENGPSSSFLNSFDDRSSNNCEERQITFKNGNHVSEMDSEKDEKKELNNTKEEETGEKKIRKKGGKKEPTVSESFNGPNNTRMSTRSSNKSKPFLPSSIQSSVIDATVISSSPEVIKELISNPATSTPRRSTRTIKKTEIALESSATKASERHKKLMKEQAAKEANQDGKNKAATVPLPVKTDGKSSKSKCINNKKISIKSVDDIDVLSGKRGEKKVDGNVSETNSDSTNPPETSTPSKKQKL